MPTNRFKLQNLINTIKVVTLLFGSFVNITHSIYAVESNNLPGSIDPGRITLDKSKEKEELLKKLESEKVIPSYSPEVPIPKGAEKIKLQLRSVHINGMTVFKQTDIEHVYKPFLGKEIVLTTAYAIAKEITEIYRAKGYFLCIAYLPEQRIKQGIIIIQVVEGYVGLVDLPKPFEQTKFFTKYVNKLLKQKPLKLQVLENFLLTLKDLPGYSFNGTLAPLNEKNSQAKEGAVGLTLIATKKLPSGEINFDNFSSKFIGPEETSIYHSQSFYPLQRSTISGVNSLKMSNMHYIMLNNLINITPNTKWDINSNFSKTTPGFNLRSLEIKSLAKSFSTGLDYLLIKQRQENLSLKLTLNIRQSSSYTHSLLFNKDKIRTIKFNTNYDKLDNNNNYYRTNLSVTKGLPWLNSSKANEINISRSLAKPNFTKFEVSFLCLLRITNNWLLQLNTLGQYAASPVYSSEEFGYGGQTYGRAFDSSDLTGDHGIAGLLELNYNSGLKNHKISLYPFGFYDCGMVWRRDPTRKSKDNTGASFGFGCYYNTKFKLNGQVGFAWPLKRKISTPIYGHNQKGPRILVKIALGY